VPITFASYKFTIRWRQMLIHEVPITFAQYCINEINWFMVCDDEYMNY
jgi:hypothetical protein